MPNPSFKRDWLDIPLIQTLVSMRIISQSLMIFVLIELNFVFGSEIVSIPKEICIALEVEPCTISQVDVFSSLDLNNDRSNELIFAHGGGSCGEQHYIFTKKNNNWVEIGNWCGVDGGHYRVLASKHYNHLDIDTGIGVLRFNGKKYPDTTSKN